MQQFRQFLLLVQKDWILLRRNKLWTFFEIVLPCLLLLPYVLIVRENADRIPSKRYVGFDPFQLRGNIQDILQDLGNLKRCDGEAVRFGYTSKHIEKIDEVRELMDNFRRKFQDSPIHMKIVEFKNETELRKGLEAKLEYPERYCTNNEFDGGIVFDYIDEESRVLVYRMYIPDTVSQTLSGNDWHMGDNWASRFSDDELEFKYPSNPPYYKSGFLTFQHAIESSFVENITLKNESTIEFQALPEVIYEGFSFAMVLKQFPILFSIISFINVVHIAREIAAENGSVKPYLRSMGLSTPMFYSSHILVGFLKYLAVLIYATYPIHNEIQFVSPSTVILTLSIYGFGALTFGVLVASFFNNANSAIRTIVILWGTMIGVSSYFNPSSEHMLLCFLYGLNINGALRLAINAICEYIEMGVTLKVGKMFNGSTSQFSFGCSLLLMVFDIFWMFGLALLVDYCRNSDDFTVRRLFGKNKSDDDDNQVNMNEIETVDSLLDGANEIDSARNSARAGISVRNLVKKWGTTGERAVDGLTFEAKQGQVSILLGHNGAGKSTTFQSIVGIVKPTQGRISIYGKDIAESRQNIGLCPQYNPLYNKLTVEEHLWLIAGLKGKRKDREFHNEMHRLLRDVELMDKKRERVMNLSGGMKRKLCVCMALIGQSNVVLLDEPTAGMDPGARKDVQDLLEREKKERTILLTTHYMDEAERFGDWILIMSHGKLVSSGTTKFLKQKYGTGYLLTVVLDVHGDKEKMGEILEEVSQFYVSGAKRGKRHGQQIEIILPEEGKSGFPQLFRAIEAIQRKDFNNNVFFNMSATLREKLSYLEMTSYGLSLNTLEQVFITIGDKVEEAIAEREYEGISNLTFQDKPNDVKAKMSKEFERFTESQSSPERTGHVKTLVQVLAILRKKLLYTIRNWTHLISQIIVPLIIIALVASLQNMCKDEDVFSARRFDVNNLSPSKVIWQIDNGKGPEDIAKIRKILENESEFEIEQFSESESLLNITENLIGEFPRVAFGFSGNTFLINLRNYHVAPTLVTLYNRARLMDDLQKPAGMIYSGISVYAKKDNEDGIDYSNSKLIDFVLSPLMVLIFALVTSSFVIFLIEERVSKFAHQQLLTGISPITFYGASFLFDFILFSLICGIFLSLFLFWKLMSHHLAYVILFWFLYFFSCVPFIYAVSSIFKSPSKANVLLVIWQIFMAFVAAITRYRILGILQQSYRYDKRYNTAIEYAFFFFLPSYSFGVAMFSINFDVALDMDDHHHIVNFLAWENLGKVATCMVLFGIVSFTLFVVLQFKEVRRFLSKCVSFREAYSEFDVPHNFPTCEAVKLEEQKVQIAKSEDYALLVKKLNKSFGRYAAIDELCMTVDRKECFGLLGVNGAGKTTMFDILTGQSFATSGEARIGGRDVTDRIPIGYCPQFDALLLDLTGREVLEILGQMHGFANYREKADLVLECVGMRQNADKLVRYYSGGQKRKISVGVALLAPTQMIILDEPTAGIDPKARREVWELLIWCRENSNSALMLTSHSMDECEALCSRIAVLNKGKLIAIGTSQELKSLYGNSYTMTLTLNDPQDRDHVVHQVRDLVPYSVLRTPESNKTVNLVWQIPRKPTDQWSEKFEKVQSLAKQLNVKDYILSQSSLEETFLRLAGVNTNPRSY